MEHERGCPDTSPADSDVEEQELTILRYEKPTVGVYVYGATVRLNALNKLFTHLTYGYEV